METSQGYRRARQLLKVRFGNYFVIAEMWVNKVAGGTLIGGRVKKALLDLADDLRQHRRLSAVETDHPVVSAVAVTHIEQES